MEQLKLSGVLYDDAKVVHDEIIILYGMVETLEKECMVRDKGKVASALFISINRLKREIVRLEEESKRIIQQSDMDFFGPLSRYVRPYL